MRVSFTVSLNGTGLNPFLPLGLTRNPFPQVDKHTSLNNLLAKLAAEPIRDISHLKQLMVGASPEFIDVCCERFKKGVVSKFVIQFES